MPQTSGDAGMSGGHFDRVHSRVRDFVEDLERDIKSNGVPNDEGEVYNFSPSAIAALTSIMAKAEKMAILMKAADYLYSRDISEESFLGIVLEVEQTL
jgi:hypothetical protein